MTLEATLQVTKDEAIEAVKAQAFEVTDPESQDLGRRIVHCFAGSIGADWDEAKVIDYINASSEIAWVNHWHKHDLGVLGPNGPRYFEVSSPARIAETAQD